MDKEDIQLLWSIEKAAEPFLTATRFMERHGITKKDKRWLLLNSSDNIRKAKNLSDLVELSKTSKANRTVPSTAKKTDGSRSLVCVLFGKEYISLREALRFNNRHSLSIDVVRKRISRGWSIDEAVSLPLGSRIARLTSYVNSDGAKH